MAETLTMYVALILAVYLGYITFRRVLGDRDDPGASVTASSGTGSFSFLLSGSWYVVALAALLGALTWPMVVENQLMAVVLGVVVVVHYFIERGER